MQLFERIRVVSSSVAGSQKQLAELLGIPQNTFQGYLKIERQDNLWPLLPHILKALPIVSRDWLYFGEGEMLVGSSPQAVQLSKAVPTSSNQDERVRQLEQVVHLQKELLEAKDKIIALHEEKAVGRHCSTTDVDIRARGVHS